ncbi:helix-turn-helix domain-containing protein [Brucepastera parasyntrophica]|uniref:helix-turn-helix domain-containing protein n=1 Tax=Brucepastera parasyntrophica TaxID=2880008 RepID=UPI00210B6C4B|nr:helix-turn-helix transcriptional regulator [Brucepastera parasyntrophica]ULQ60473.1 helix-turn-helix domain-containing protein [Brucepastera parasyntrophica]
MSLGDRIRIILNEQHIKQIELAEKLGISANYVNLLVNGKKTRISDTLAQLIEERYGYSSQWLLTGTGEKLVDTGISDNKIEIINRIKKMSQEEVNATMAFIHSLEKVHEEFKK